MVHNLVSFKLTQSKRIHESLDLSFGPMQKKRHLLEKLNLSFNFLGLEFLQDPLVVFAADDREAAVSDRLDGGCSRLIV